MYRHPVNPTQYVSQSLTKLRNYVNSVSVQYHWPTLMVREWSCQVKQAPPCSQLAKSPCVFVAPGIGWFKPPAKSFTSALVETTWVAMQVQTKRVTNVDNQKTRLPICGHHLQISLYRVGKAWKRVKKIKHLFQLSVLPQWLHYLVGWFMNDSSLPCQQTRNQTNAIVSVAIKTLNMPSGGTRHTQKPFPAKAFLFLPGFNLKQLFIGHLFWSLEAKFLYSRLLGINASHGYDRIQDWAKGFRAAIGLNPSGMKHPISSSFMIWHAPIPVLIQCQSKLGGSLQCPIPSRIQKMGPASCGTALPSFCKLHRLRCFGVRAAWHRTHCKNGQDLSPNTAIPAQFAPNFHV